MPIDTECATDFMKMYELQAQNACKKKRGFRFNTQGRVEDHVKKSALTIRACRDLLFGDTEANVKARFEDDFNELSYPTQITRDAESVLAWKEIDRFVSSELSSGYRHVNLAAAQVDIGVDSLVEVAPDFVRIGDPFMSNDEVYDGVIEVCKLHAGKPHGAREAKTDLAKYAMIKYARQLVSPGKKVYIVASDIYLKRADDAGENARVPKFTMNFWEPGGNNVISLSETYIGGTERTHLDETFEPVVNAFIEGVEAEECSESDCRACSLYDLCHYAEPPIRKNKTHVQKTIRDLCLTTAQDEAIEYEDGVVRINAGAGVGKTVVVALRAVTLLNKGVKPDEILLITFTNAGAEEMRTRIAMYNDDVGSGEDISDMKICTFNSFGDDILKEEYSQFGFTEPPKVIDDVERAGIISNLLKRNIIPGLNYKQFTANSKYVKGAVFVAAKVFDIIKKGPYTIDDIAEVWGELGADCRFATKEAVEELIKLYDDYDSELRDNNLIEFADQEMMLFELLQKEPYYLERFNFKHIVVDEFQDTNLKQMELLKIMEAIPTCESLMVVGDDSQAIFSFRNTSPEYIINFKDYIGRETDDIFLLENHRCTPEIIAFANAINDLNNYKVAKELIASRPSGTAVTVKGFHSIDDEEKYILDGVKEHLAKGTKPEDIAIICATKSELRRFGNLLTKEGIESVSLNPEPLIENSRVKAAISFVRCLDCTSSPNVNDILVYENAKIGGTIFSKSEAEVEKLIEDGQTDITIILSALPHEKKEFLLKFLAELDSNDDEIYQQFLDTLGRKDFEKIIDYCNDFLVFGSKTEARREHDYPGVVLTTCHSSKGMEWPIVYASISQFDSEQKNLHTRSSSAIRATEETRRLLFVTATRARDELYVTGRYIAYGKKGSYTYNQFLRNSFECNGQTFSVFDIQKEADDINMAKKKARAEERRKIAEKLKKDSLI